MSHTLMIQPVTVDEIPAITQLWYTAFNIPINLRMFPDTPGVRAWWNEANRHDVLDNPLRKLFKVVDPFTPDQIIAYAKWDLDPSESGARFPPWHEESDRETCERLFTGLGEKRRAFLGPRKHFYLDMLVTHPEYRGRGAASLLVKWGCDLADEEGVPAYLDAHEDAAPLYRKFGFQNCYDQGVTAEGALPMIREPQRQAVH
ncbi:GNAT domain-containing protein [Penicillium ucsense]|uniref:GNAT domain-containing protein n=1 Tax=Penicillium ucsense TaxID=2839758 RepID=A0A8J8WLD9_9EURO|nr:GNAT domain-containing protein [Penicillium ucsense]KAF7737731.1 GNAT domain-containing protein [Penicillium ucsense]